MGAATQLPVTTRALETRMHPLPTGLSGGQLRAVDPVWFEIVG
jgi:hypothetical protein